MATQSNNVPAGMKLVPERKWYYNPDTPMGRPTITHVGSQQTFYFGIDRSLEAHLEENGTTWFGKLANRLIDRFSKSRVGNLVKKVISRFSRNREEAIPAEVQSE